MVENNELFEGSFETLDKFEHLVDCLLGISIHGHLADCLFVQPDEHLETWRVFCLKPFKNVTTVIAVDLGQCDSCFHRLLTDVLPDFLGVFSVGIVEVSNCV